MRKSRPHTPNRSVVLDDIDRRLLAALQTDARTSNVSLAALVGLQPSSTLERVRRLEEGGVITGYYAVVEPGFLERPLLAFVDVHVEPASDRAETERALAALPDVLEVHRVAGDDGFLVKTRARDTLALARTLDDGVATIAGVRSLKITIVLDTVKETSGLPTAPDDSTRRTARKRSRAR